MFWLLAGMSVVVLAPCLFVPPAEALAVLAEAEVIEAAEVELLEAQVEQQLIRIEKLTSDPLLYRRLALRELGYRPRGRVQLVGYVPPAPCVREATPGDPRDIVPAWVQQFYPHEWAPVYRDPVTRQSLWYLSVAVMFLAVVMYAPKRRSTKVIAR